MPIVRTYQCEDCFHRIEVTLEAHQWDDPPPPCPACATRPMQQEFKPPGIIGSPRSKAVKMAETIASEDYGVSDFHAEGKEGHAAKHRLKDQPAPISPSTWTANMETIATAAAQGRKTRMEGGDGLDILQRALKSGDQPDLIAESKKRMARIW
jgi:hypothetical protein